MPIQFPRQTGPVRSYIEAQWWANASKTFNAVPAPNMARPGLPFNAISAENGTQVVLDPGYSVQMHTNVRRLNTMYQAPDQTANVNPADKVISGYIDEYSGDDRVLGYSNNIIIGVSRDANGLALGNCVVKVFRTSDDTLVGQTTSDGSGNWTAYPNAVGPYYFVEYKAGSPDVFGTSPNTNTATQFLPGQ